MESPIFHIEPVNVLKLLAIMGEENKIIRHSDRRNKEIIRPNRRTVSLDLGTDFAVHMDGIFIKWQRKESREKFF